MGVSQAGGEFLSFDNKRTQFFTLRPLPTSYHWQNGEREAQYIEERKDCKNLRARRTCCESVVKDTATATGVLPAPAPYLVCRQGVRRKGLDKESGDARQRGEHRHKRYRDALHKGGALQC